MHVTPVCRIFSCIYIVQRCWGSSTEQRVKRMIPPRVVQHTRTPRNSFDANADKTRRPLAPALVKAGSTNRYPMLRNCTMIPHLSTLYHARRVLKTVCLSRLFAENLFPQFFQTNMARWIHQAYTHGALNIIAKVPLYSTLLLSDATTTTVRCSTVSAT